MKYGRLEWHFGTILFVRGNWSRGHSGFSLELFPAGVPDHSPSAHAGNS